MQRRGRVGSRLLGRIFWQRCVECHHAGRALHGSGLRWRQLRQGGRTERPCSNVYSGSVTWSGITSSGPCAAPMFHPLRRHLQTRRLHQRQDRQRHPGLRQRLRQRQTRRSRRQLRRLLHRLLQRRLQIRHVPATQPHRDCIHVYTHAYARVYRRWDMRASHGDHCQWIQTLRNLKIVKSYTTILLCNNFFAKIMRSFSMTPLFSPNHPPSLYPWR